MPIAYECAHATARNLLENAVVSGYVARWNQRVELSDATSIVTVTLADAMERLVDGDPRKDPYVEALAAYFEADDGVKTLGVLYAETSEASGIVRAFAEFGEKAFVLDVPASESRTRLSLLLSAALLVLALAPSRGRLFKSFVAAPWALVLPFATPVQAVAIFMTALSALSLARSYDPWELAARSGILKPRAVVFRPGAILASLAPTGIAAVAIVFRPQVVFALFFCAMSSLLAGLGWIRTARSGNRFAYVPVRPDASLRSLLRPSWAVTAIAVAALLPAVLLVETVVPNDADWQADFSGATAKGTGHSIRFAHPPTGTGAAGVPAGDDLPGIEQYLVHRAYQEALPLLPVASLDGIARWPESLDDAGSMAKFARYEKSADGRVKALETEPKFGDPWRIRVMEEARGLGIERHLADSGGKAVMGRPEGSATRLATSPSIMYILILASSAFAVGLAVTHRVSVSRERMNETA